MHSQKETRDGREMLFGAISQQQLYFDFPDWKAEDESYQPDSSIISQLRKIATPFQVKIFLGTWCPDSRRETPRFFKIIRQAGLTEIGNVEMWAMDRKKKLPDNSAGPWNIERVATFIFIRDNREIGRIVETPDALTLEENILTILTSELSTE
jgi:hypothetical protein